MSREMLRLDGEEHTSELYINPSRVLSVEVHERARAEEPPYYSVRLRMNIQGLSYHFEGDAGREVMIKLRNSGVLPGGVPLPIPLPPG